MCFALLRCHLVEQHIGALELNALEVIQGPHVLVVEDDMGLWNEGLAIGTDKALIPQPHVIFDDKYMWTLDHLKGIQFQSPNVLLNQMTPEQRDAWLVEYKKGFTIK